METVDNDISDATQSCSNTEESIIESEKDKVKSPRNIQILSDIHEDSKEPKTDEVMEIFHEKEEENLNNSPSGLDSAEICGMNLGAPNTKCCIRECSSNFGSINSKTTFVAFPKDPSRFAEWSKAIKRPDLNDNASTSRSNLLICTNHFPNSMWVKNDSKRKKLRKSAIPELKEGSCCESEDDADDTQQTKDGTKNKSNGLKVKKVASLLTASALKDSLTVDGSASASSSKRSSSKWGFPLQRKSVVVSTEKEKRLLSEIDELKSELDKNMDNILNQKSHYEGILSKEKEKASAVLNKLNNLESDHRKMTKNFESQISSQKVKAMKGESSAKDSFDKLKKALTSSQEYEKKFTEAQSTISILRNANDNLISRVNEMADNSPPPPTENILQGENFKVFLNGYLKQHQRMKEKMDFLTQELQDKETIEGQKSLLLSLASQHLNHGQFSWLQAQLSDCSEESDYPEHFKEFCVSLYRVSEAAYKVCTKAFGLAPIWCVISWVKNPEVDISSVNSLINTLFEESKPLPKDLNIQMNVLSEKDITEMRDSNGRPMVRINANKRSAKKRKAASDSEESDDDFDEGKLTDEEEELCYSSESDERMDDTEASQRTTDGRIQSGVYFQAVKKQEPSPGPSHASTQPDFDFMLEETSQQMGNSMPILVPDSPMVPLPAMSQHNKKMPDVSTPSTSGSKVIFRVVES